MLGFIVGTICLLALLRVLRGRSCARRARCRGGSGIDRLLGHLDADDEQRRAIETAVDELRRSARQLRDELRRTRNDLGEAIVEPDLDETTLGELFARHDGVLEQLRRDFVGALARIHDALDDRQRARLGRWLRTAPAWSGPYRS